MDKEMKNKIGQALENLIIVSSSIDEDELKDMLFDVYSLIQDLEDNLQG